MSSKRVQVAAVVLVLLAAIGGGLVGAALIAGVFGK